MKTQKRTVIVGIAVLIATFGLLLAACDNSDSPASTTPQKKLISIAVTTPPDKTQYTLNEAPLDTTGMVVTATYDDGSKEAITEYTLSGFSSATAGNKTITVGYGGQTTTFMINVIDPSKPTVVTPTATPSAGEVASGTTVSLISSTPDAEIWYTANGSNPAKGASGSTKYTVSIPITTATIIKAIAVKDGMNDSGILEAAYTIVANNGSFTNIADISAYLITQTGGTGTDAPLSLAVRIDFGNMAQAYSGWQQLLDAISTAGKYVDLDLSACTMTGTYFNPGGDMFSFNNKNGRDLIVSITLPNAATSMGNFRDFDNLKIFSGANITIIGQNAFSGCTSLAITELPAGLTYIDYAAFYGCTNLTQITLPGGLTSIGPWAFAVCTNLTQIILPEGLISIGEVAFSECSSLTQITLPAGLTSIGDNTFQFCTSLTQITLPAGVTSIGDYAFSNCTSLTSISLPAIADIGIEAFKACTSLTSFSLTGNGSLSVIEGGKALVRNNTELTAYPSADGSITLPAEIISIGDGAFSGCINLTQITLPNSLISIGNRVFYDCTNLVLTALPAGLTSIGDAAFFGCTSLTLTSLPEGLTSINNWAFERCTSLTQITLPVGITSIGFRAFDDCTSLILVTSLAQTPPVIQGEWGVFNNTPTNLEIKVPVASVEAYKSAENWSTYADKISAIEE